ncbi:SIR2 family protein [Enterovibrio norvegicus]|uniref:SIR2 family protein n=1 Tax=Enterovibrio norvegicus TaxID=188144 RepID=UPI0010BEB0F5|nr:SIR2 family protein [Enterovibrio norvegicus]TKF33084.1 hypothetical protein FCV83_11595 [Enterovibrio norvegicus]
MNFKGLDLSKLATPEVDLTKLKNRLSSGNAVLITGAGFSLDCENISGGKPPLASELSEKLCETFGLESTTDLKYTSDICLKYGDAEDVLEVLRQNFNLVSPSEANVNICSIPWRRIYTTNYDNSVELSYLKNKKRIESLSLMDKPNDYIKNDAQICIHLNGSIQNAVAKDLDYKIRLSDSSYLSADFFLNSKWRTIFNRDLENSAAIIFVGYSLYDFDLEKILNDRPHLAGKTYFIVHDGAKHQLTYKLSNYGYVSKIGTEGFGKLVTEVVVDTSDTSLPECFTKRIPIEIDSSLNDIQTQSMLLYGKYENQDIDTIVRKAFQVPYMFERKSITYICDSLISKKNVFVQSDLGNGKSVLLNQVASTLSLYGYNVWEMTNFDGMPCKDLDIFTKGGEHILIIDDAINQDEFFEYYTSISPNNITFLLSNRSSNSLKCISILNENNIDIKMLSLDILVESEIEQLVTILEDQNLWKQYTGWKRKRKIELIKGNYGGQLSSVLLDLLKSPDIKERITYLLEEITSKERYKKTLFSIALCDIFNIRKELGNISDIAGNEDIFTAGFQRTKAFATLFSVGGDNTIKTKSSILSLFIVNSIFSDGYIVENCLEMMERIDGSDDAHLEKLHAKLRTFGNIEKLIPQKQNSLNNYFVELKRKCTWLRYHPHYWVQYAMCRLSFGDTFSAQGHLNSAYEFAAQRASSTYDYHTENIDTQQARLYLMEACDSYLHPKDIAEKFEKSHALLLKIANDNHKFRQVLKYEKFYAESYGKLSPGKKAMFEHACKKMLEDALKAIDSSIQTDRVNFIHTSIKMLRTIIAEISAPRCETV